MCYLKFWKTLYFLFRICLKTVLIFAPASFDMMQQKISPSCRAINQEDTRDRSGVREGEGGLVRGDEGVGGES